MCRDGLHSAMTLKHNHLLPRLRDLGDLDDLCDLNVFGDFGGLGDAILLCDVKQIGLSNGTPGL